jgi:Glutathione S-transferase, N-terminal domain
MKRSHSTANSLPLKAALFPEDDLWDSSWSMGAGEETIRRRMFQSDSSQLQFYSSWFCPFAQRTWIALEEAKVNYQWNEVRFVQFLEYHVVKFPLTNLYFKSFIF